jgi:hypothetical protein
MVSSDSGKGKVAGSHKHNNESLSSIKAENLLTS